MNATLESKMRVTMVTTSYPAFKGDASGSFILEQANALVDAGHAERVCVITPDRGAPDQNQAVLPRRPGIEVIERRYFWPRSLQRLVASGNGGIPYALRHSLIAWLNIPFLIFSLSFAFLRRARSSDVYHMHWGPLGALAIVLRLFHRRPVVVTIHGSDLRTNLRPLLFATSYAIRRADAVLVLSQEFLDRCVAIRGKREGIYFAPNGVRSPEPSLLNSLRRKTELGKLRLLTVGRLIPQRNHDLLVTVVARLHREFPGIQLEIVGGGPNYETLKQQINGLKADSFIKLHGDVATDKVENFYLQSDLYVSPTSIDNYGTAVVEAALHGMAVVTTRVGFPGELVRDQIDGRVIEALDCEALYQAVRAYLVNPTLIASHAASLLARATSMGLSWPACAARVGEIYRTVTTVAHDRQHALELPTI